MMNAYRTTTVDLKFWRNISNGIIISFIITLLFLLGLSVFIFFSDFSISEKMIHYSVIGINFFSIFIGSFITAHFAGEKGFCLGMLIGLIYTLIILFLGFGYIQEIFSWQAICYKMLFGIIAGICGGILGVNL